MLGTAEGFLFQILSPLKAMSSSSETESDSVSRRSPDQSVNYSAAKSSKISVYSRRAKRKKSFNRKRKGPQKNKKSMKKFEVLIETLKPIPFAPAKDLDFSSHEKLLKRLGLWDFVHLEFDREIRSDLVAQMIANYNPGSRGSYVNDMKVMVNRADLARALKLPAKKGVATAESSDSKESEESIGFILELVSNWVLLHDDTWMTPSEVLNWMKVIKEGNLEKVDWATMMWFMVEKELIRSPQLTDCYYASHLQCLIKSQKEELLLPEVEGSDDDSLVEIDGKKLEEEVDAGRDSSQREAEGNVDPRADDLEEENTELSLAEKGNVVTENDLKLSLAGEDKTSEEEVDQVDEEVVEKVDEEVVEKVDEEVVEKVDEAMIEEGFAEEDKDARKEKEEEERVGDENSMDYEGCKTENNGPNQWIFEKSNEGNDSGIFLRQCSFGVELNKDLGYEDERQHEDRDDEEEEVGQEEEEEERANIEEDEEEEEMEEDEQGEGGFHLSPKGLSLDAFPSDGLLHSLEGGHMSLGSGMPGFMSSRDDPRNPARFGHVGTSKREISHEEDDHHNLHFSNKRFRTDGTWENEKSSSEYDMCLEQIQIFAAKARTLKHAKEQEVAMNQQILMNEVQQRDHVIEQLQKARAEERNMKDMEIYRLNRELCMMDSLFQNYRSALRETRKAFSEYRARCPEPCDPLYKEVAGTGGLVISVMELEKQRLKQEEEDRMTLLAIQTRFKDFEEWWDVKFTDLGDSVNVLVIKLVSLEEEMKLVKESHAKRKLLKSPECAEADS